MLFLAAIRNLSRNTRRTITILVTLAVGTCSLFVYHGFNTGIMNQYRENSVHALYGNGQIFSKGYYSRVFERPWEHWLSNWTEVATYLKTLPEVKQVFPRISFPALLTNGSISVSGMGLGIDTLEESKFFYSLNVVEGKNMTDEPDGLILGLGLARCLGVKPGSRVTLVGQTINGALSRLDLTVTGIFHTGSKAIDDVSFRIPLPRAQTLLDTGSVESLTVGLDRVESWPRASESVLRQFADIDAIPFNILDKVYYQHSVDWLKAQYQVISVVILAMIVLGIFNTVSTAVLERKQEIGNLRANGESVSDVLTLLGLESLVLGVLGSLLGIALSLFIVFVLIPNGIEMPPAPGLTRQFFVKVELQGTMAMGSLALGVLCALLATWIAGIKAARASISEALRSA
ncbi:MAG: ABC transporter permease [Syntrophobacteraceae bacterium]